MTRSAEEKSASADGVIVNSTKSQLARTIGHSVSLDHSNGSHRFSTQSLPRAPHSGSTQSVQRFPSATRASSIQHNSEASLSPCLERRQFDGDAEEADSSPSPPPKPIRGQYRNDSINIKDLPLENGPINRVVSYHASGSDSGNGSGDSAQSSAAGDPLDVVPHRGGVIIKNPRYIPNSASSATLKSFVDIDYVAAENALLSLNIPQIKCVSKFDLENFHTLLLPAVENKPLDNSALNTFRMMLSETGPRVLANHITRIDIKLILGDVETVAATKEMFAECTGLELIGLTHGDQFRFDLIERTECIKLLVAVTILTCSSDAERAETLNKWIQVAVDTKTALGNLFGFCAIMLGLCMPQVSVVLCEICLEFGAFKNKLFFLDTKTGSNMAYA